MKKYFTADVVRNGKVWKSFREMEYSKAGIDAVRQYAQDLMRQLVNRGYEKVASSLDYDVLMYNRMLVDAVAIKCRFNVYCDFTDSRGERIREYDRLADADGHTWVCVMKDGGVPLELRSEDGNAPDAWVERQDVLDAMNLRVDFGWRAMCKNNIPGTDPIS